MVDQPSQRFRRERFAWRENDWEETSPLSVHVRTVAKEQFHHRNAIIPERRAHQRTVAPLVDVRPVVDHPLRHCESDWSWWFPGDAAFRYPGERPILAIADWSAMQEWAAHLGSGMPRPLGTTNS